MPNPDPIGDILRKLYAQEPDSPVFENHAANAIQPPITSRISLYEARATFHRKEAEGILTGGMAASDWISSTADNQLFAATTTRPGTGALSSLRADRSPHPDSVSAASLIDART